MEVSNEKLKEYTRKIMIARMRLLCNNGFYGLLLMHMRMNISNEHETAWSDLNDRLYFNPDFLEKVSDRELDYVMMHLLLHVVLKHLDRKGDYDDKYYDEAADIVVNSNILRSNEENTESISLRNFGGVQKHMVPGGNEGWKYSVEEVFQMLKVTKTSGDGEDDESDSDWEEILENASESCESNEDGDGDFDSNESGDPEKNGDSEGEENSEGNNESKGQGGTKEKGDNKENNDSGESNDSEEKNGPKGDNGAAEHGNSEGENNLGKDGNSGENSPKGGNSGENSGKDMTSKNSGDGNESKDDNRKESRNGNHNKKGNGDNTDKKLKQGQENGSGNSYSGWDYHNRKSESDNADNNLNDQIWQERIMQAVTAMQKRNTEKNAGQIPAFAERYLEELKKPQTDWRTVLDEFIQEEVCDYSFCPPDRRFDDSPFFLPDFNEKDYHIQKVLFMIDTSGSMSDGAISQCYSEIKGAIDQFNGKLEGWLGFFDAVVVEPQPFMDESEFMAIRPEGGGGTRFDIIFDYVAENMSEEPPISIVILTDGYAPFPEEKATHGIPVLWIIDNEDVTPLWGKIARIQAEE